MAENARNPIGIRVVRPYASEDEFLANEIDTIGKTSVLLVGAHARPNGVILRFEVTLSTGASVLRGEGRVLGHKEKAFRGQQGLALRFTRLDPKSKALVDRAAAIREGRPEDAAPAPPVSERTAQRPPKPEDEGPPSVFIPEPSPEPPPLPPRVAIVEPPSSPPAVFTQPAPPPMPIIVDAPSVPAGAIAANVPQTIAAPPLNLLANATLPPTSGGATLPPSSPPVHDGSHGAFTVERPANRDDLLGRLRSRAANLSTERVAEILAKRS